MYLYHINFKYDESMKDFIRETDNVAYGTFNNVKGAGVYQIRCKSENKAYIGSSTNCQERIQKHFSELRLNKHTNKRLQEAYNKYGFEDFIFSIVLYATDVDNLLEYETNYQIKLGIENIYNDKISGYYISDELQKIHVNSDKSSHKTEQYRAYMASIKQTRKIARCDYNTDKILYVYENFHALQKANPNIKRSTLLSACNGNKKSAYGYKWKYVPMDIPTGEYHEID